MCGAKTPFFGGHGARASAGRFVVGPSWGCIFRTPDHITSAPGLSVQTFHHHEITFLKANVTAKDNVKQKLPYIHMRITRPAGTILVPMSIHAP